MTNLDSILKQRHYFLHYYKANKGPYSQSYGFSSSHVWMWELDHKEGWALKNWCFWPVMLEKTLESPRTARTSNQSILMEINSEYSLEGQMLRLKLQTLATWCKERTHLKRPWCWERLRAEDGDDRGWDGWITSLIQWTWVWVDSGSWWWIGRPGMLQFIRLQSVGHDWATELDWIELRIIGIFILFYHFFNSLSNFFTLFRSFTNFVFFSDCQAKWKFATWKGCWMMINNCL